MVSPLNATTPPPPRKGKVGTPAFALDEWEVKEIVDRRRVGKSYEYKVRWKDTWLRRSEFGNAQRLLREFEAQDRVQRKSEFACYHWSILLDVLQASSISHENR